MVIEASLAKMLGDLKPDNQLKAQCDLPLPLLIEIVDQNEFIHFNLIYKTAVQGIWKQK